MSDLLKKLYLNFLKLATSERPGKFEGAIAKKYLFASNFVKGKVVLDLGCGFGDGTNLLAKKASKVYGIDISAAAIAYAKIKYARKSLSFEKENVLNIKYLPSSFDVITAFELIEHITPKQQAFLLKKIITFLKQNGVFILSTPNKISPFSNIRKSVPLSKKYESLNPYHTGEFTLKELKKILRLFFRKVIIYGVVCKNKKFLTRRQEITNYKRRKVTDYLSQYKLTHKLLPFIPKSLKNFFSFQDSLPNLIPSDFLITRKDVDRSENLLAICQKNQFGKLEHYLNQHGIQ